MGITNSKKSGIEIAKSIFKEINQNYKYKIDFIQSWLNQIRFDFVHTHPQAWL